MNERLNKKAKMLLAGTAIATLLGAGASQIPQVQETASGIVRTITGENGEVPPTFDNNALIQTIGDSNTLRLTPEEAGQEGILTPNIDLEKKTVTMPFPFTLPIGTTATIDKTPYSVREIQQHDPRVVLPENSESIFSKGTKVILIKGDGRTNPNAIYTIITIYQDPGTNIFHQSQIEVGDINSNIRTDNPSLSTTEYVELLKKYNWDVSAMIKDEKVLTSDGKPMTKVVGDNQQVHIYDTTFQGSKTDGSRDIVEGMKREFTTVNDRLLTLTSTP